MENEQLNSQPEEIKPQNQEPVIAPAEEFDTEPPAEVKSEAALPEAEPSKPKKKNLLQKSLTWTAVVLVALLIGFSLAYFLLYMPANNALSQVRSDLVSANSALELEQTKAEGLQTGLTDANNQLESAKLSLAVSNLQANISYARIALSNKDILTSRQELADAEMNLEILTEYLTDSETAGALADRLESIRMNLTSDSSMALEEMRIMGENLARLENR
jgi:septal ring factor EnvC (AmiA/AmiB activator)